MNKFIKNIGIELYVVLAVTTIYLLEPVILISPTIIILISLIILFSYLLTYLYTVLFKEENDNTKQLYYHNQQITNKIVSYTIAVIFVLITIYVTFLMKQSKNREFIPLLWILSFIFSVVTVVINRRKENIIDIKFSNILYIGFFIVFIVFLVLFTSVIKSEIARIIISLLITITYITLYSIKCLKNGGINNESV
ncbi:hypothetical protein [Haploplasma axanthum]|uniref:Uncharacterized protein n=1 Tax=Haploplasma axanthum TaxID=29552 RepID=A0A449BBN1_HAPAX|nr:hypothetical protein [Haploplasma axanthum]VEU79839.1 Uncharacterised protein [Haploplasma axanthum]